MILNNSPEYRRLQDSLDFHKHKYVPCIIDPQSFDAPEDAVWPDYVGNLASIMNMEHTARLCFGCPVFAECIDYARAFGPLLHGVVAGSIYIDGTNISIEYNGPPSPPQPHSE